MSEGRKVGRVFFGGQLTNSRMWPDMAGNGRMDNCGFGDCAHILTELRAREDRPLCKNTENGAVGVPPKMRKNELKLL